MNGQAVAYNSRPDTIWSTNYFYVYERFVAVAHYKHANSIQTIRNTFYFVELSHFVDRAKRFIQAVK